MRRNRLLIFSFSLAFLASLCPLSLPAAGQSAPAAKPINFNRSIRPILSDTCFACHGPDGEARLANLRLDIKDGGAFEERDGHRLIVPGDSARSVLYQRVSSKDEATRMPPANSGRTLTEKQIDLIKRWIDEGAKWDSHWALQAPARPPLPTVKAHGWPRNPIDYFVLARLEGEGLRPAPRADRATLLRRVTLDLTGLPPTPAEIDSFLADKSPHAYEKRVDQLLGSPHYGERMAMQWLDLGRYADTHGFHIDSHREMWHWRDWVIKAFNRNMPFDQFAVEQLAGDLLTEPTPEQRLATGFNRNHVINYEGGAIPAEYQNEYVVDRVETVGTVFMGLTIGCARCHDHKYDPIRQKDFYGLYAFFNNAPEKGLDGYTGNALPIMRLPSDEQRERREKVFSRIATLEKELPEPEISRLQSEWQKTATGTIPSAPRDGLFAHYPFDKDLADATANHRDGKVLRGGDAYDYGMVGKGWEVSGEAHVEFTDTSAFDFSKPFTLASWYTTVGQIALAFVQKLDLDRERRGFELQFDDTVWKAYDHPASRLTVSLIHRWPDDAIQVRTKESHRLRLRHLAVTYDGSGKAAGFRVYYDGKPVDVEVLKDNLTGPTANDRPIEIGNAKFGRPLKGRLDDMRFYDRQLSSEEVTTLSSHEPARSLAVDQSGACGRADALPEIPKGEDPLIEQSLMDTPEFTLKAQCKSDRTRLRDYFLTYVASQELRERQEELTKLRAELAELDLTIPSTMVMSEMTAPRETHILARGDYRNKGEKVTAAVPAVFPPLPKGMPLNRLGLAKWLTDPSHPLTSRVAVNRFWQVFFGIGLVKTSEDFGSQGEPPSHPQMFDWLATEFVHTGWDVKALMRLIVTSATYRQSSRVTPALVEKDPDNRLYARGPRFRMPAEMVRDNALAVSGLLVEEIGGPSVYPYQPPGLWEEMAIGQGFTSQRYSPSHGKDLYRRSMYTYWKRTVPPPSLSTFDAPDREKCVARRAVTNTPLQALVLMNDPTYIEASRHLAERMLTESPPSAAARIRHAFRLATGRAPTPQETAILRSLAREELANYQKNKEAAERLLKVGESPSNGKLDAPTLAAWTTVASAILNLDQTITKE